MKARLAVGKKSLARAEAWIRRRKLPRDLAEEVRRQRTPEYWRRRVAARSRRWRIVALRYRFASRSAGARNSIAIAISSLPAALTGFATGGLLFALIVAAEAVAAQVMAPRLVPTSQTGPPLGAFPTLAVQISASLLGFYLAAVSIVLGTSYQTVSADVRRLVLRNSRTRLYLGCIGLSIGAGLALVLLQSLDIPFGYASIVSYGMLVGFSGWAFGQLAFGAFNLFNPVYLAEEPLSRLYRAIDRLGSTGLSSDEAVLRTESAAADRALDQRSELIEVTYGRASIDREALARTVEALLAELRAYAAKKHALGPQSSWFPQEANYPKWIEADQASVDIALRTSTPLQPRLEPDTTWLERRAANLACAALEACVSTDDRTPALRITRAAVHAAEAMARAYRLDDAIEFAGIVRDRCWSLHSENATAQAVASEPPLILSNILLAWRDALQSWPDEIERTVQVTNWENARAVPVRGTRRIWEAGQRLLSEVQAEVAIEGRRVTPDWYLRFALAGECVLTLREFAQGLPQLLDEYVAGPTVAQAPAAVRAGVGAQALQMIVKATMVAGETKGMAERLQAVRLGHDPLPMGELDGLDDRVAERRSRVLGSLADTIEELTPEPSHAEPDAFGEALFTVVYETEQAIAQGDVSLLTKLFPSVFSATFKLDEYVRAHYSGPSYQVTTALFDPVVDLLELSGLAVIYDAIREDGSADPVLRVWQRVLEKDDPNGHMARHLLNILDAVDGGLSFGISPRSVARTGWGLRLCSAVLAARYGRPEFSFSAPRERWQAPLLFKILGVSADYPALHLHPRALFVAKIIAPFTGESDMELRSRRGLQHYYESLDFNTRGASADFEETEEEHEQNADKPEPLANEPPQVGTDKSFLVRELAGRPERSNPSPSRVIADPPRAVGASGNTHGTASGGQPTVGVPDA